MKIDQHNKAGIRRREKPNCMSRHGHQVLPKKDYTVVANYFFDHVMPRVKPAEWKIICAVIRETTGWQCDDAEHPESCRRLWAEISIDRFKVLTGLHSEALVSAIQKCLTRGVVQRHTQQFGRQRKFRFTAVPRANLKSLEDEPGSLQEALPFNSDFGNRNPNVRDVISEIEISNTVSDFGNRNPDIAVLNSIKKDPDLKHTHSADPAVQKSVCAEEVIDRKRYKAYARSQPSIVDPIGWATKAERTREWDEYVLEWEQAELVRVAEAEKRKRDRREHQAETDVWVRILEVLRARLDPETLQTWLEPIQFECVVEAQHVIHLRAPNQVVKDWVVINYGKLIGEALNDLKLSGFSVGWTIGPTEEDVELEAWQVQREKGKPPKTAATEPTAFALIFETPEQRQAREQREAQDREATERGQQMLAEIRGRDGRKKFRSG